MTGCTQGTVLGPNLNVLCMTSASVCLRVRITKICVDFEVFLVLKLNLRVVEEVLEADNEIIGEYEV